MNEQNFDTLVRRAAAHLDRRSVFGLLGGTVLSLLLAWVAGILLVRLFYTPAKALAANLTGTEAGGGKEVAPVDFRRHQ